MRIDESRKTINNFMISNQYRANFNNCIIFRRKSGGFKLYMKDSESAANERYRITWAPVSTARLDTKLLKEEAPEIYREYLKTTSTRRFTVSAA